MIHADNVKVEIKGSRTELQAELTFIIKTFIQNGLIIDDDHMIMIYKLATMSSEEVHKEACEILDSMGLGEALGAFIRATRFSHE